MENKTEISEKSKIGAFGGYLISSKHAGIKCGLVLASIIFIFIFRVMVNPEKAADVALPKKMEGSHIAKAPISGGSLKEIAAHRSKVQIVMDVQEQVKNEAFAFELSLAAAKDSADLADDNFLAQLEIKKPKTLSFAGIPKKVETETTSYAATYNSVAQEENLVAPFLEAGEEVLSEDASASSLEQEEYSLNLNIVRVGNRISILGVNKKDPVPGMDNLTQEEFKKMEQDSIVNFNLFDPSKFGMTGEGFSFCARHYRLSSDGEAFVPLYPNSFDRVGPLEKDGNAWAVDGKIMHIINMDGEIISDNPEGYHQIHFENGRWTGKKVGSDTKEDIKLLSNDDSSAPIAPDDGVPSLDVNSIDDSSPSDE